MVARIRCLFAVSMELLPFKLVVCPMTGLLGDVYKSESA